MTAALAPVVVASTWKDLPAELFDCQRRSTVVVDVAPGSQVTDHLVADAILDWLGKNPSLSVGNASHQSLAVAWLSLGERTDAVIVDAQLLPAPVLSRVVGWLLAQQVRPWLLATSLDADRTRSEVASVLRMAQRLGGVEASVTELSAVLDADSDPVDDEPATVLPTLPAADGFVFRTACRDLLDDDDFARVDDLFVEAVESFRAELAEMTGAGKTRKFENLLKARLVETPDRDSFVLQVRAAQVAGLKYGFHVLVNNLYLFGAVNVVRRIGLAGPERWWELLDQYREPVYGAIAALYAAEVSVDDIATLTIGGVSDLASDGSITVTAESCLVRVPAPQSRFLAAQKAMLRFDGAGDNQLFTGCTHVGTRAGRYTTQRLSTPPAEVGVQVADLVTRAAPQNVTTWLRRHGIIIQKLSKNSIERTPKEES